MKPLDAADSGRETRPDAKQHRLTGSYLAADLLRSLGAGEFDIEAVKFLVRQHDSFWCLYSLGKYNDYNNHTLPGNFLADLHETAARLHAIDPDLPVKKLRDDLLRAAAVMTAADVAASGDRYLSDQYVRFTDIFTTRVEAADADVDAELASMIAGMKDVFERIDSDPLLSAGDKAGLKIIMARNADAAKAGLLMRALAADPQIDNTPALKRAKDMLSALHAESGNPLANAALVTAIGRAIPTERNGVDNFMKRFVADPEALMSLIYGALRDAVAASQSDLERGAVRIFAEKITIGGRDVDAFRAEAQRLEEIKRAAFPAYLPQMRHNVDEQIVLCGRSLESKDEKRGIIFDVSAITAAERDIQLRIIRQAASKGAEFIVAIPTGYPDRESVMRELGSAKGVTIVEGDRAALAAAAQAEAQKRLNNRQWQQYSLVVSQEFLADYAACVDLRYLINLLVLDKDAVLTAADIGLLKQLGSADIAAAVRDNGGKIPAYYAAAPASLNDLSDSIRLIELQA